MFQIGKDRMMNKMRDSKTTRHRRPVRPMSWLDIIWALAVATRSVLRRAGLPGALDGMLRQLAPHIVPPPRGVVEATLPFGLRMRVPPGFPSARTYVVGRYEPEVTRCFMALVKSGMTVVDVGANVGYYTLLASRLVGDEGRVYSFEPYPPAFEALVANIEANECHNVTVVPAAVSDHSGMSGFHVDPYGAEGYLASAESDMVVPCTTLDDYFGALGWPAVHLVKMDIEGSEPAALRGMRTLLQRNPGLMLIMELNWPALERAGCSYEEMSSLLCSFGFCQGYIIERGMKRFALPHGLPRMRFTSNVLLTTGHTTIITRALQLC
jgi:FkbM family methyltransferase